MSNKLTEKPTSSTTPTNWFANIGGAVSQFTASAFSALIGALIGPQTAASTSKATPVDTDKLPLSDSASSDVTKHVTWANIKSTLDVHYNASYAPLISTASTLTYNSSLTPNCNDGLYRKVVMTGNPTLNAPTNGSDGMKWKCRFTASGADRTLTIHSSILVPSESVFAGTQVITSGETWIVQLEHNGTAWMLQTLIGGWA